jgi:hypothetical protein
MAVAAAWRRETRSLLALLVGFAALLSVVAYINREV